MVLAEPPAVVSFTFGLPDVDGRRCLAGRRIDGVSRSPHPRRRRRALGAGPDALCLQGAEAGAHRGSLANDDRPDQDRPIARPAGGGATSDHRPTGGGRRGERPRRRGRTAGGRGARWCRRGPPSSAVPRAVRTRQHKDALVHPEFASRGYAATAVTRAFSGRRARALVNTMVRTHRDAPPAYPEINNATRPLRARAAQVGDTEHMSLYAGIGFRRAEARPAARSWRG